MRESRVLFVGGFRDRGAEGGSGGQVYACRTLIQHGRQEGIRFACIDSTEALGKRSVPWRCARATARMLAAGRHLSEPGSDVVFIFASSGMSFVEKGLLAMSAKWLGRRVVFCPRSGLLLDDLERSAFMRWYVPTVFRHCDVVVCQGESWRKLFAALPGVSRDVLEVVPNWLEVRTYRKGARQTDAETVFLYLGRIEPYKGIFDLIAAVRARRGDLGGAEIWIAGGGAAEVAARAQVKAAGLDGCIRFLGWVHGTEKERVLAEADVLVLPSHREGMPNAVLEAMASHLPIIATRVGGVPDILTSPELGLLVEARDPEMLGAAVVKLHTDRLLRERMGRNARQYVEQHHDLSQIWPRVRKLLLPDECEPGLTARR